MRAGIVLDKLIMVSDLKSFQVTQGQAYTARIPPPTASILGDFRRLPFPRPLERHRGAPIGTVVANKLHVGILVEVWVGVEFACDEILDLSGSRSIGEGETRDVGIDWLGVDVGGDGARLCLAQDKVEGEDEFVVAIQLEEKGGGSAKGRRFGVLAMVSYE